MHLFSLSLHKELPKNRSNPKSLSYGKKYIYFISKQENKMLHCTNKDLFLLQCKFVKYQLSGILLGQLNTTVRTKRNVQSGPKSLQWHILCSKEIKHHKSLDLCVHINNRKALSRRHLRCHKTSFFSLIKTDLHYFSSFFLKLQQHVFYYSNLQHVTCCWKLVSAPRRDY